MFPKIQFVKITHENPIAQLFLNMYIYSIVYMFHIYTKVVYVIQTINYEIFEENHPLIWHGEYFAKCIRP